MFEEDEEFLFDGEIIDFEELETILRAFALELVHAHQPSVIIEHADHLTLQ